MIEPLENRIAPATLIDLRTIAFTDADGDEVKVTFSRDVFSGDQAAQLALANQVFKFDAGTVDQNTDADQQLRLIDFTKFPVIANKGSTVNGVGVTIVATQVEGGDGLADVGAIKAAGVSLGKVVIDGDLGQIDAGGSGLKIGLAGLTVQSLGKRGTATQIPVPSPTADNPAPDLVSTITGELTSLLVLEDVKDARVRVVDGQNALQQITTIAKLGRLEIRGSLLGRVAAEAASDDTGFIESARNIGTVVLGSNAEDGIFGGGGSNSGRINAGGKIGSLTIKGNIVGGAGANSGGVTASSGFGKVTISGDLAGSNGDGSGAIRTFGNIDSLIIGDDIVAGIGPGSGLISALGRVTKLEVKGDLDGATENAGAGSAGIFGKDLLNIVIHGSLLGGANAQTAFVESTELLTKLTVNGNLTGGIGDASASVIAHGDAKTVLVKGDLTGGVGKHSGMLRSGFNPLLGGGFGSVTIGGKVTGGGGDNSGSIVAGGDLRMLKIGSAAAPSVDALKGGGGQFSGAISAQGLAKAITIFGNIQGSNGPWSGTILSRDRMDADGEFAGDLGTIKVTGRLVGGVGPESGAILADGALGSLSVAAVEGGTGPASGKIETGRGVFSNGNAASIRIAGVLAQAEQTPGAGSASILVGGMVKTLSVNGAVSGATIRAGEHIAQLALGSDVAGTVVSAFGQAVQGKRTDVAIGRIAISGNVENVSILAGYDLAGAAANPDAQIGQVSVKGNWSASNLVAGAAVGADAGFGNALDAKAPGADNLAIVSSIARIQIRGTVSGESGENFGFVAQYIAGIKFGTQTLAFNRVADAQVFEIGGVGSGVTAKEIVI